jgi:hypothetical protein
MKEDYERALDLVEEFIALERDSDLFGYKVKKVVIWDYIRYNIFYEIIHKSFRERKIRFKKVNKIVKYLSEIPAYGISRINRYVSGIKEVDDCDILLINYERKGYIHDNIVNIHTYPIGNLLKDQYKILLIEHPYWNNQPSNLYSFPVIYSRNWHRFDRLKVPFVLYNDKEKKVIDSILSLISERFNVDLSFSKKSIMTAFSFQLIQFKRYLDIFSKTNPKVVLFCDDAGKKGMIEAAHHLKISVIDFQHSLVSRFNILYNYPKGVEEYNLNTISDYIFTFSDYWDKYYKNPSKKIAVGFPYLEIEKKRVMDENRISKCDKTILFISDRYSQEKQKQIALELSKMLPGYDIIFKLRKGQYSIWKDIFYPDPKEYPNIQVAHSDETSLYEYFVISSFQIGVNSTALIEGLAFGLNTFIIMDFQAAEVLNLINDHYAYAVKNAKDIYSIINDITNNKTNMINKTNEIFKKNSLSNIKKNIENIIDNNSIHK